MKIVLRFLAFAFTTFAVATASPDSQTEFRINGKYISIESSTPQDTEATVNESKSENLPAARVVVSYEITNESGISEVVELASGRFVDNKIQLSGYVDKATFVQISVESGRDEKLSETALAVPGGHDIAFALVEQMDPYLSDFIVLLGESRKAMDASKRFTVRGYIDSFEGDLSLARVDVRSWLFDDGIRLMHIFGFVMLEDGRFLIEGETDEPLGVTVNLDTGTNYWSTPAVIEPGANLEISWNPETSQLLAKADRGRHINLVEGWQQSEEYFNKGIEIVAARNKERQRTEGRQVGDEMKQTSTESVTSTESALQKPSANQSTDLVEVRDEASPNLQANLPKQVAGCEHVSMDGVQKPIMDLLRERSVASESSRLRQERDLIRKSTLQDIAKNLKDPLDSLLAMELGAFLVGDEERDEAFPIYERLAVELDEDLVSRRVVPLRDSLAANIAIESNEESLIQGQKVPDFRLADLEGNDINLYEVLNEKEIVLIDFWASWCGPCIATFPRLKKIYDDYQAKGFEIISVSLDSELVDWSESAKEQDLPWVNLGEIKGMKGPIAVDFGVQFIPKNYLVDTKGCILRKDLHSQALEEFLAANTDTGSNP